MAGHTETASTENILLDILDQISLNNNEVKERNKFVRTWIQNVIERLKIDDLFNELYQEILWTGSFYEGLKIEAPDEFDLNMVMKLPMTTSHGLEVTTREATPGFVNIKDFRQSLEKLKATHPRWPILSQMLQWCDNDGFLRQDKVHSWIHGLFQKYLFTQDKTAVLFLTTNGPAMTLMYKTNAENKISFDLVAVFEFRGLSPPSPYRNLPFDLPWFAVPKPKKGETFNKLWRLSFNKHEKKMLNDQHYLKPAIKIIKKLRDSEGWHNLVSYYIKSVALWELHDDRNKQKLPDMNLSEMFWHLLRALLARLENNNLTFYWDPRNNLLDKMTDIARENIVNRLRCLIGKFETDPSCIKKYILK